MASSSSSSSVVLLKDEVNCFLTYREGDGERRSSCEGVFTLKNQYHQPMWVSFQEMDCGHSIKCLPNLSSANTVWKLEQNETASFTIIAKLHYMSEDRRGAPIVMKEATLVRATQVLALWGFDPGHRFVHLPNLKKEISCRVEIPCHPHMALTLFLSYKKM
jgi:hypothetical protein